MASKTFLYCYEGEKVKSKIIKLDINSIGILLMCVYVFMTYNAVNIFIPSIYNTLILYVFFIWGVLVALIKTAGKKLTLSSYTAWYAIFMIASLAIMLYSPEKRLISGQFYLMIVSLCLTLVFQLFIKNEHTFSRLGWAYAISSFVLILSLYLTDNLTANASNRLGGDIMGNPNIFASMIMVAVLYEIWLFVYGTKRRTTKLFLIFLLAVNMYALIISAGRKYFVVPFIFFYILLLFKVDKKGKKHIIRYTVYIGLLATVAYTLIMKIPVFYETIGHRMESFIEGFLGKGQYDSSASIRKEMRILALRKWFVRPFWGYGFDSFKYYAQVAVGHFYYSHCNFTELLYNGGIIYFGIYYWIFYKIFKDVFIYKKGQGKYKAFAAAILVSFLVLDYVEVSYSMAVIQIMIAMALKCLTFENKNSTTPEIGVYNL